MPDSFFVSPKNRKRKRSTLPNRDASSTSIAGKNNKRHGGAPRKNKRQRDEELDSDATQEDADFGGVDDLELRASDVDPNESAEEDEDETPAQKRLRLAKLHLESVKQTLVAEGEFDAAEIDKEIISSRLRQEVAEHSGKLHKFIADKYDFLRPPLYLHTRGHRLPITCARGSSDGQFLYTCSKEGRIVKWDLSNGKQLHVFHKIRLKEVDKGKGKAKAYSGAHGEVEGHTDEIWTIAVSDDGRWLASAGKDKKIVIWDVQPGEENKSHGKWVKNFKGHRDSISALSFQRYSSHLYSASYDRSINHYDLSAMGYVETLFGHQEPVTDLALLRNETAVSAGGRDTTVRYWKVADEKQLVFRGGGRSRIREVLEGGIELDGEGELNGENVEKKEKSDIQGQRFVEGSIECVAMVDESTFISGGDSGSIRLWLISKKKSQFTVPVAHGLHEAHSETEGLIKTPRWITSMACVPYGDLLASGSWEGIIRLWRVDMKSKTLTQVGSLPAPGFVNSLQFVELKRGTVEKYQWCKSKDSAGADHQEPHTENGGEFDQIHGEELQLNGSLPHHDGNEKSSTRAPALLLIAGLGQEPRFGRWMVLKGHGEQNCTKVYLLRTAN